MLHSLIITCWLAAIVLAGLTLGAVLVLSLTLVLGSDWTPREVEPDPRDGILLAFEHSNSDGDFLESGKSIPS